MCFYDIRSVGKIAESDAPTVCAKSHHSCDLGAVKTGNPTVKWSDMVQAGMGAVIGFALAQLVNLVKLGWDLITRPRFRIEHTDNCQILSHSTAQAASTAIRDFR